MSKFTKAPRDNFKFGGNLSYFTLRLTGNLAMTNFLYYPQTYIRWAKLLILNMFSNVPRGQVKKVMNFALWSDIRWYGLALFLDAVWWIEML